MTVKIENGFKVTMPAEIIKELGLSCGNALEIYMEDDSIIMTPAGRWTPEYREMLKTAVDEVSEKLISD